jgi:uncharacterized membrane protein
MRPIAAVLASALLLAACEQAHDGQDGPNAGPPADAPAPAPPAIVYPADMDLAGTEPFWAVKIRGGNIAFTRPDAPERDFSNAAKAEANGGATWTANDANGSIVVKLTAGTCSDGMSDKVWSYSAVVTVGEETLKGCGEIPPAPSAAQG